MLQVARLAPTLLQSSADLVGGFFRERYDPAGGFTNRAGLPDLYYTVFGLEGMAALQAPIDADRGQFALQLRGDCGALLRKYVESTIEGQNLLDSMTCGGFHLQANCPCRFFANPQHPQEEQAR